jgi:hypothetical protein
VDRIGGDASVSVRNIIQTPFDEFAQSSGFTKKSGSWYRRSSETIVVLNLQKSQYGPQYYVNVGLWLLGIGPEEAPKENHCHVRTRLEFLVPTPKGRVTTLLDLASPLDDRTRREELLTLLKSDLLPVVDACATLEDLRSGEGRRLIDVSLVEGPAQRLLAAAGSQRARVGEDGSDP